MVENISFKTEDDTVLVKYNEIWKKIKKTLDIKFHSEPQSWTKYMRKTLVFM